MTSMTPEGKVKAKVKAILTKHGCWFFAPVSNGMGTHGIPDFICCIPFQGGKLLAVECKARDGAVPTPLQLLQLGRIDAAGGLTYIATPGNVNTLDVMLTAMKAGLPCK